jgi:hypothetical protein
MANGAYTEIGGPKVEERIGERSAGEARENADMQPRMRAVGKRSARTATLYLEDVMPISWEKNRLGRQHLVWRMSGFISTIEKET